MLLYIYLHQFIWEESINQFTTSFTADIFLNVIYAFVLTILITGFSFLKKSITINKKLHKIPILFFSAILTLGLVHLADYLFDQSFFIFLSAIAIISFYIIFENYFENKIILPLAIIIMSTEVFLWQYYLEPIWTLYIIKGIDLLALHVMIPIIAIFLSVILNIKVKWFAIKASLTITMYFIVASIAYTTYVSNNEINWFVSVIISTIYMSIVSLVSSILDRYLSILYRNQLKLTFPKLGMIQSYSKAESALQAFAIYNNVHVAPFLVVHFPLLYDVKKYASYRSQKQSIMKYLTLVEKSINLIIPGSKVIFFEAGYYEVAFLFTIPGMKLEDVIKNKKKYLEESDIYSLNQLLYVIRSLDNFTFQVINDKKQVFNVIPNVGLSFYGYHGELFEDLLQQSMVNLQDPSAKKIWMYTASDNYQKINYKLALKNIIRFINSPLIQMTSKPVMIKKTNLKGEMIAFQLQEDLMQTNIINMEKTNKAVFYSQKMYWALSRIINKDKKKIVFVTIPNSYFVSKIFNFNNFVRKISDFETRMNLEIEIVIRDKLTSEALEIIKKLRIEGVSFSSQKINQDEEYLFNYIFENNAEFTGENLIEPLRIKKDDFMQLII